MDYIYHMVIIISLYTILSQSLNIFSGYTQLLSLTHAGFYGIGAYISAILTIKYNVPLILIVAVVIIVVSVVSYIISLVAVRSYDDYFVVAMLSLQLIIYNIFNNWISVTNGPRGLTNISRYEILSDTMSMMFISVCLMLLVYLLLYKVSKSLYVLSIKSIKDDEILLRSLGKNVNYLKASMFSFSAVIASLAGILYAQYFSYIDPTYFTLSESIFILSIILVGGLGSLHGAFLATIFMVLLPELIRFIGFNTSVEANLRQILYGSILVFIVYFNSFKEDTQSG